MVLTAFCLLLPEMNLSRSLWPAAGRLARISGSVDDAGLLAGSEVVEDLDQCPQLHTGADGAAAHPLRRCARARARQAGIASRSWGSWVLAEGEGEGGQLRLGRERLPPGSHYAVTCGHCKIVSLHTPMISGGRVCRFF